MRNIPKVKTILTALVFLPGQVPEVMFPDGHFDSWIPLSAVLGDLNQNF